jgi:hypothetical protein
MAEKLAAHLQKERHKPNVHTPDEPPSLAVKPQGIVGLQRYVGNQGVQRLLAQGLMQMKPEIQRCSSCAGNDEEVVQ